LSQYPEISVFESHSILSVLEKMDKQDRKLFLVFDIQDNYIGLVSAGDIQRAILKNIDLNSSVANVLRTNNKVAYVGDSNENILAQMQEFRMEFMPILNSDKTLHSIVFWDDFVNRDPLPKKMRFNLPVVFMAGGTGSRMKPLTNVLPKPLIPVGDKTIAEEIFSRFAVYGVDRFLLSLNYKADFIINYLTGQNLPYRLESFIETKALGTIGSLKLMKDSLKTTFFISNCDILIKEDYSEILDYHLSTKNKLTIVTALKTISLPYGIVETKEEGQISELKEKPTLNFKVNTGMYIMEPELIDDIPEDTFFNITDLIDLVIAKGGRVGAYPIVENAWVDTGIWSEYIKHYVDL
jgi:dTDP-glucose pyrophosphorylase